MKTSLGRRPRPPEVPAAVGAPAIGARRPIIRRAVGAVVTNGISSIGNLALSIAIAHIGSLAELGEYGVALAVYVLATGVVRATVTDTVLTKQYSVDLVRRSLRRVVLMGLIAAALTCGAGIILAQLYILLLGCALPGIVVYDYLKLTNLGTGSVRRAMVQECSWTAVTLVFVVLGVLHRLDGHEVFAGWALSCAAIGLIHGVIHRCDFRPGWNVDRDETKVGVTFAMDFLAGSGTAQVTTMAVAAAGGIVVAGALRGAGTILAPLMIISGTLPSLLLPYLAAARRSGTQAAMRTARMMALAALAVAVPIVAALLLIPAGLGHVILGSNWAPSRSIMPMIAVEVVFTILGAIPFCGHRVERAGTRALVIRLIRAPFHIGIVVASAALFGAPGAAFAMAAMSFMGAASWWLSYRQLLRRAESLPYEPPTVAPEGMLTDLDSPVLDIDEIQPLLTGATGRAPVAKHLRPDRQLDSTSPTRRLSHKRQSLQTRRALPADHAGRRPRKSRQPWLPMTTLLALQYGVLAIWPAWRNHDSSLSFIIWIVCLGTGASLVGESFGRFSRRVKSVPSKSRKPSRISPKSAAIITIIGFAALYLSVAFGARTYADQLGLTAAGPLAKLATPFTSWALVGTGLSLYCWTRGSLSRRATLLRIGLAAVAYIGYALSINITASLAKFLLAVAIGALITRLVRLRWLLVGLLVGFLVWPTLYNIRNSNRSDIGASGSYGQTVTASSRLREDILLEFAAEYPAPIGIPAPSWATVVRYGAIPSAIDPFSRPDLRTAKDLSSAVGGSPTNSMTFTLYGNIRAVAGAPAVIIVMILIGFGIGRMASNVTPMRIITVMATAQSILWIESMYPDGVAGVLQTVVSAWIALLCLAAIRHMHSKVVKNTSSAPAGIRNMAVANRIDFELRERGRNRRMWSEESTRFNSTTLPVNGRPQV